MIVVRKATENDYIAIAGIGKISVAESHKGSSSDAVMDAYLEENYNSDAIRKELRDPTNIYHILHYNNKPAGFSKIILDANHPNIEIGNVTKLDRVYLLKEFYGLKLGLALLNFNIELSKEHHQAGMWLYTWTGNTRAVDFYRKAGFTIIGNHKFYVTTTHFDLSHQMFLNFNEPTGRKEC